MHWGYDFHTKSMSCLRWRWIVKVIHCYSMGKGLRMDPARNDLQKGQHLFRHQWCNAAQASGWSHATVPTAIIQKDQRKALLMHCTLLWSCCRFWMHGLFIFSKIWWTYNLKNWRRIIDLGATTKRLLQMLWNKTFIWREFHLAKMYIENLFNHILYQH